MRRSFRFASLTSLVTPVTLVSLVAASTAACGGKMYVETENTGSGSPGGDTGTVVDTGSGLEDGGPNVDGGPILGRHDAGVDTGSDSGPVLTTPDATTDAGVDTGFDSGIVDEGPPSTTYPAFTIDGPIATSQGGPVLSKPTIVTVTWPGDDLVSTLEDFGDKIGTSDYWLNSLNEYGVGEATSGAANHVHIATAITTFSDSQADALVVASAGDPKTSGWPAPTPQTVYILYIPQNVSFTISQGPGTAPADACSSGIGGYHTNTQLNDGTQVAYAVVPRCQFDPSETYAQTTTSSASHELAEAATDPLPQSDAAFVEYDDAHLAWSAWQLFQTEIGDDCEFYAGADIIDTETTYEVQRLWSNKSFLGGHTGCVPRPSAVYFNTTPLNLSVHTVNVTFPGTPAQPVNARTINIPKGTTGVLEVGFYSDGARGDWTLSAIEGNNQPGSAAEIGGSGSGAAFADGNLSFSIDQPTGQNGHKANVSITVSGVDSVLGANLMTLISTDTTTMVRHIFPVIVSSN